ncbi:hypothetical protein B0H14DRAFT_2624840 [Mycena olivaceomarginata]|nr:hypothetical protein B0H14DRAFT_2624840 [Mycena olivaceomarginata]
MSSATKNSNMVKLTEFQLQAFKDNFPITANSSDVVFQSDLTPHQLKIVKQKDRNEKARLRMAKKRAEIKTLAPEIQEAYVQKARAYKAKYRESHRKALALKAEKHRRRIFKEKHGAKALVEKRMTKIRKRLARDVKAGLREPYSGDEEDEFDKDPDLWRREAYM